MAAKNDVPDVFLIDVFDKAITKLEVITGNKYKNQDLITNSFRVILDHIRAVTFLISDGAIPSNKDQGYFTRRLIRRSIRFLHKIKAYENPKNICHEISAEFIETYKDYFNELEKNKGMILSEFEKEEIKFKKTLEEGIKKEREINENKSF